jgi:hypothetical protein
MENKLPLRMLAAAIPAMTLLIACGGSPNEPDVSGPGALPGSWYMVDYNSPGWSEYFVFEKSGAMRHAGGGVDRISDSLYGKWELLDGELTITADSCVALGEPSRRSYSGCTLGYHEPEWDASEKRVYFPKENGARNYLSYGGMAK